MLPEKSTAELSYAMLTPFEKQILNDKNEMETGQKSQVKKEEED